MAPSAKVIGNKEALKSNTPKKKPSSRCLTNFLNVEEGEQT